MTLNKKLFLLVGNSGSGKDSLINEVVKTWPSNLPQIRIPHRYITRPPHETEPFHSVTKETFDQLQRDNKFCLSWHIYGLDYGVSCEILDWLNRGHIVVINVSRSIIDHARKRFPYLKVIFVKVPFAITLERIKNRGRESENDPVFRDRVERARKNQDFLTADFIVKNEGPLEIGVQKLRNYLINQFS
ncbi:Ribose 1,5-bisphosphate phosphokinase PhnN [Candidatus Lokiarchaeum ossiferum]|uniref:Ribose 1,5-bisphosphate phosphokinase PhnN n=1 Tax=Candidatus Lokiarchaeum ossiferum TaxID=2951803 RepID=A0ABY6HRJ1_9ARCH|nr:Ribose 1,5-bisphosphate phosphokinase PhnN [Candidatus Lokiarchaeum sp. B-35]